MEHYLRVQTCDNFAESYQYSISKCSHHLQIIDSSTLLRFIFSINPLIHYQQVMQLKFYYRSQLNTRVYNLISVPQITRHLLGDAIIWSKT